MWTTITVPATIVYTRSIRMTATFCAGCCCCVVDDDDDLTCCTRKHTRHRREPDPIRSRS